MPHFVVDAPRRETIIQDDREVDAEDDGKVETHPAEIKGQSLAWSQLMEKLLVEQIEHPSADAQRHKGDKHPIDDQHIGL